MIPRDRRHFLLEVPGLVKLMSCLCHRGAEGGGAQGLLHSLKVLHHELLLQLTLLHALFQASKLQCPWIVTTGELCCICKSLLCIKGTSEQVSAVHMKGLLSLCWGKLVGGHHSSRLSGSSFLPSLTGIWKRTIIGTVIGREQFQALRLICRARKCPVLWVEGGGGEHETMS